MKGFRIIAKLTAAIAIVALIAPTANAGDYGKKKDIVDTAVAAGQFTTLAAALTEAGLVDALKGDGPFTVFAPTDDAFAKLPKGTVENLLKPENKDQLIAILTYHVVSGKVMAKDVTKLSYAASLNGQRIDIKVSDGGVMVDKANVVKTDIKASNGVIHVIDTVILPQTETIVGVANEAGSFGTLIAAAKAAGLAEVLMGEGPFTVFAPTDDAFAKLPQGTVESLLKPENKDKLAMILKYHVVSGRVYADQVVKLKTVSTLANIDATISLKGDAAMINDAKIVATDIEASNGVIHVIDSVILPQEMGRTNSSAANLIEMAINRGAPMYNNGNAAACAYIYEMTANALIALGDDMPATAHMALNDALTEMRCTRNDNERAWAMRRGLDRAYDALTMEMASAR